MSRRDQPGHDTSAQDSREGTGSAPTPLSPSPARRSGTLPRRLTAAAGRVGGLIDLARRRLSPRWTYVLLLFVGSKIVLTLVGMLVLHALDGAPLALPPDDVIKAEERQEISSHRWFSMWFAWDAILYHRLEREPLDSQYQACAFPMLYPLLARAVSLLLGGHTALALLVVGNVAYLFVLYYAYRLAEELFGDGDAGRRCAKYVVLMPTAFLFHAALTESLFVGLALAAFYHAERRQWVAAGVIGYFLALSRSIGFLVAIPLALVLLRQREYRLGPRSLLWYLRTGWPLVLVPAGWLTFMAFSRWQCGDWFAYQRAQQTGWQIVLHNPAQTIRDGLTVWEPRDAVRVWFAIIALAVLATAVAYLRPAYLVYGVLMVVAPLIIGPPVYKSLLRYLLAVFPLCLIFGRWARQAGVDAFLTAALALVQGALFVLWLAYWTHFII